LNVHELADGTLTMGGGGSVGVGATGGEVRVLLHAISTETTGIQPVLLLRVFTLFLSAGDW
jgi:hypothetical protein